MVDTTFVDNSTVIVSAWLNDINDHVYNDTPITPATTVHDASVISNTPAGGIVATTVQAAIDELDTEKQTTLISGTNIKTINSQTLLGSGDISLAGDVIGPSSSIDSELVLFDGTTGKLVKSATTTGLLKSTSGVISAAIANTDYIAPSGALGTPSSGTLTNCTKDGTYGIGYLEIPQNSQSDAYTLVLGDSGKHLLHPSADTTARTFTIPANASVAYPVGTAITFVNQDSAGSLTIEITSDTMRLAGAGTTGNRTLAANGVATAIKLTTTEWIISGTNLS